MKCEDARTVYSGERGKSKRGAHETSEKRTNNEKCDAIAGHEERMENLEKRSKYEDARTVYSGERRKSKWKMHSAGV